MMKSAYSSTDSMTNIRMATTVFACAHCGGAIQPRVEHVRKSYNGQEWILCMSCHKAFKDLCNEIAGNAMSFYLVRTARKTFRRLASR
jgi:predicted metal-binding protein